MRLLVRWTSTRPAAQVRVEGAGGVPREEDVVLPAATRLGLALAGDRGLGEDLRRALTERILGDPGVHRLITGSVRTDDWSGGFTLLSEGDPGVPLPLWRATACWDGRAWSVTAVEPPTRAREVLAMLGQGARRHGRSLAGALLLLVAMAVSSSPVFWMVAERHGARTILPFAGSAPADPEPSIGILLVELPTEGDTDRALVASALVGCLAVGARTVLVDVPLDISQDDPRPNEEVLLAALQRHGERVIGGGGKNLSDLPDLDGVALTWLGLPLSDARGAGVGLVVALEVKAPASSAGDGERLQIASVALAERIAQVEAQQGRALPSPVPVFRTKGGGIPWLPFAMAAEEAEGDLSWLPERQWPKQGWEDACSGEHAATILAIYDVDDRLPVPILGAHENIINEWKVFGPRRIAAFTRQILARAQGRPMGLRMWDLEIAARLSPAPDPGEGAASALRRQNVDAPGPLCWLANGLWFTPFLLLQHLLRRLGLVVRALAPIGLQVLAGVALFWSYALYPPLVAAGFVLIGGAWWRRRARR